MKEVPPKKPHFFKPILPGFKNGLKIPIGFLKYLKRHEHIEHAILKRGGKKWPVKVNGRRFEDGWAEFAEEHDLQLGDMLVFRHEGNMEFDVSIFGSSHCEREYAAYMQEDGDEEEEEAPKKFDLEEKPKADIKASRKAFSNVEAANKDKHLSHSHLICTIRPYCLLKHFLHIPRQFALDNRLNDRKRTIIMRDERRSWTLSVYKCCKKTYIGRGWREFCTDKCLKEGDRVMFEIVSNGEIPIFKFHDLRLNKISDVTAPKSQLPASTSADANPHFVSTIKPYTIKNPVLYLPLAFAKSNGLMNRRCEMTLVDEKRRSWSVWLGPMGHHFGIKRGWREFVQGNGVQIGDTYMFELINNGAIPIAHFHCKYSEKDAKNDPQMPLTRC